MPTKAQAVRASKESAEDRSAHRSEPIDCIHYMYALTLGPDAALSGGAWPSAEEEKKQPNSFLVHLLWGSEGCFL